MRKHRCHIPRKRRIPVMGRENDGCSQIELEVPQITKMSLLEYVKESLEKLPKISASERLEGLTHLLNALAAKYLQLQLVNQHASAVFNKERYA